MSRPVMHVVMGGAAAAGGNGSVPIAAGGAPAQGIYTLGDVLIVKCHRGKVQEIRYLLEEVNADINYRNQNGCTALHAAASSGQLEVVEYLLNFPNVDRQVEDDDGQTPLHYAAFYGHLEVVQLLVDQGVPIDGQDKFGRLAHCFAAINGHLDVVEYLVDECADPIDVNIVDDYGSTCLHWAASKGRKEVIQYLCMKGIDVHITSFDNRTAYQLAKDKHKQKCVQFLKSWYDTSQKFVHAAEDGDDEQVSRMIAEIDGAYPLRFMVDKNGKNAMHWAAEFGHLSTLKLLGEHFAVWTDADKFGRNALHCAALGGHKHCAFWLVRKAPDASQFLSLTLTNKTPSRCAFEAGHSTLAARLQAWEEGNAEFSNYEHEATGTDETVPEGARLRGIDTVKEWLSQLKMDEYVNNFERDGFDDLRTVATIDEEDLKDMKVKKGHRRMVLSNIEDLRTQLQMLDAQTKGEGQKVDPPTLSMLPPIPKAPSAQSLPEQAGLNERRGSLASQPPDDV